MRRQLYQNVFDAALDRLLPLYEEGHRLVVSFSGGKDSNVCLELCLLAARLTGRLPVDVVMRDEEVMFPGTYEYAERVAAREDVNFVWLVANQPVINVFNRSSPYFWVFDPTLDPEDWVRQPPSWATYIQEKNIDSMTTPARFPPAEGKDLYAVIGLRTSESRNRLMGLMTSGGHITKPNRHGVRNVRPVYDWEDADVWRALHENKWDYNQAYDVMYRLGVNRNRLRIAPPTMSAASVDTLSMAQAAWPRWFDRVAKRLPGVRTAAQFGKRAVTCSRRLGDTWEETYRRECIDRAPAPWLAARATAAMENRMGHHSGHANTPFPDVNPCRQCNGSIRCWKDLCLHLYNGDPFSLKATFLPYIEPEFFRQGAGTWDGKPSW